MRLLIIRHAIAMDRKEYHLQARREARLGGAGSEFETNDDFRPLTPDGIRKMKKNAKGLKESVTQPDLLVTSPLTRALQTSDAKMIQPGASGFCALTNSGDVYCWGYGPTAGTGITDSLTYQLTPAKILSNISYIAGRNVWFAIGTDNQTRVWGSAQYGEGAQSDQYNYPRRVPGLLY